MSAYLVGSYLNEDFYHKLVIVCVKGCGFGLFVYLFFLEEEDSSPNAFVQRQINQVADT